MNENNAIGPCISLPLLTLVIGFTLIPLISVHGYYGMLGVSMGPITPRGFLSMFLDQLEVYSLSVYVGHKILQEGSNCFVLLAVLTLANAGIGFVLIHIRGESAIVPSLSHLLW